MSGYARTNLPIDERTNENLEFLKKQLNSPKIWIVRRLVEMEAQRVREELKLHASGTRTSSSKKLEAVAK